MGFDGILHVGLYDQLIFCNLLNFFYVGDVGKVKKLGDRRSNLGGVTVGCLHSCDYQVKVTDLFTPKARVYAVAKVSAPANFLSESR